jgi:hypothetical protein
MVIGFRTGGAEDFTLWGMMTPVDKERFSPKVSGPASGMTRGADAFSPGAFGLLAAKHATQNAASVAFCYNAPISRVSELKLFQSVSLFLEMA